MNKSFRKKKNVTCPFKEDDSILYRNAAFIARHLYSILLSTPIHHKLLLHFIRVQFCELLLFCAKLVSF